MQEYVERAIVRLQDHAYKAIERLHCIKTDAFLSRSPLGIKTPIVPFLVGPLRKAKKENSDLKDPHKQTLTLLPFSLHS